jgi:hypothetical protein
MNLAELNNSVELMVSVIAANRFVANHDIHGLFLDDSCAASVDFVIYVLYASVINILLAANDFMLIV